jgi:uncharacterized protein YecE (DUF72 family)
VNIVPRATKPVAKSELTREQRRAKRELRRAKQRMDNIGRAAKMHAARPKRPSGRRASIGPEGISLRRLLWLVLLEMARILSHRPTNLRLVWPVFAALRHSEINASFYSWPTVANVRAWRRQPGKRPFVYTVKAAKSLPTLKNSSKTLIQDFGMIADILGDLIGCFLFQLPPSYRYTKARLSSILSQLDPTRRNVVEFRHPSSWNDAVDSAFGESGTIYCSCSGPKLSDKLVRTVDGVYLRMHGPDRWYRHNYSSDELSAWRDRIIASGAKRVWVYFNNDSGLRARKCRLDGKLAQTSLRRAGTRRHPASSVYSEASLLMRSLFWEDADFCSYPIVAPIRRRCGFSVMLEGCRFSCYYPLKLSLRLPAMA